MANLVIIGNGFDLAHELETSYTHFLNWIFRKYLLDSQNISNLVNYPYERKSIHDKSNVENIRPSLYVNDIKSIFFKQTIEEFQDPFWGDIENCYFRFLEGLSRKKGGEKELDDFQSEFLELKKYLIDYLEKESKKPIPCLPSYQFFFDHLNSLDTLFVNFNYTSVVAKYIMDKEKLVQIHGELKNPDNPIIFGYAANEDEVKLLLEKNNNEWIRNIKRFNYPLTDNYQRIIDFLMERKEQRESVDISILGHSCSMSDKLILSQLIQGVGGPMGRVRFFYFDKENPHENFTKDHINLSRVMNGELKPEEVVSFSRSHRMPQKSDNDNEIESFKDYIETNYPKNLHGFQELNIRF